MRFTHIDVNFDVRYEGHQNCPQNTFYDILRVFSDHHLWHQNWHQYLWTSLCQFIFFVNLLHSPGVWFFDIWHLFDNLTFFFDNLTSFWHLTYNMGTWWTCAGSCVQWILPIPIRSRWGTGMMGHMGNGAYGQWAHGQWGPWVIGTFWPITSLLLDGFLQKFTGHRY